MWNHLPGQVIHATALTTFKETALPIIRSMQPPVGSYVLHISNFLLAQHTLFFCKQEIFTMATPHFMTTHCWIIPV